MEQHTEIGSVQGDSPAPAAVSLGAALRGARERLGLSVADVASQTKLAPRQIEALETEDFRHLPEMPFVRGFVRSYAKILHLDAQPLLACLPQASAETVQLEPASVEAPFPSAHSPQRQNLVWLGAALLLSVLVVAFAVWHLTAPPPEKGAAAKIDAPAALPDKIQTPTALPAAGESANIPLAEKKTERPPAEEMAQAKIKASPAEPQALPAKPQSPESAPPRAATLRLAFGEESWTEIRDRNDKVLSSQVNPAGSELRLNGQAPFTLVIGHAASARLYYRGKQVDLTPHISSSNDVARLTLE